MTRAPAHVRVHARGARTIEIAEETIQKGVVDYLRLVLRPDMFVVFSVPNGAKRGMAEAGVKQRTGLLAGVWDICILGPGGSTWWMEAKTNTGRLSAPQEAMGTFMINAGVPHRVVRSIDDARKAVRLWGLETREAA